MYAWANRYPSTDLSAEMCQDPNHLFLLFQILTKIRMIHHLFMLYVMAFISPFHVRFNFVLYQNQISRKMPKILWILQNSGSRIRVGFWDFNPRRAGAPKLPCRGEGASRRPPPYSTPRLRSEKREKVLESSSKIISKLFQSIF